MLAGENGYWRIGIALFFGLLLVGAMLPVLFQLQLATYPFDYYPSESELLVMTHRVLRGDTIYNRSESLPLIGNVYPPLCPWIMAGFSKLVTPTLGSFRLLALIPFLSVSFLAGALLRRAKAAWPLVAAGSLLIPCCYNLSGLFLVPRNDSWMTLFCMLSLWFISDPKAGRRQLILGALFTALAMFTKQTALTALAALHLHLLIKDWRKGLLAAGSAIAFCVVLLVIFNAKYGADFVFSMTSLTVRRQFMFDRLPNLLVPEMAAIAVILAIAVARGAVHAVSRQWDMFDSFLLGYFPITLLMAFNGSGINYILPLLPVLVVSTILGVKEWLEHAERPIAVIYGAMALGVLQVLFQAPYVSSITMPEGDFLAEGYYAAKFLTSTDGPVYTERTWGPIADRLYVRDYYVEPTHLQTLAPGVYSNDLLEVPFREKRFTRVLMFANSYHPGDMPERIARYYKVTKLGKVKFAFSRVMVTTVVYLEPR